MPPVENRARIRWPKDTKPPETSTKALKDWCLVKVEKRLFPPLLRNLPSKLNAGKETQVAAGKVPVYKWWILILSTILSLPEVISVRVVDLEFEFDCGGMPDSIHAIFFVGEIPILLTIRSVDSRVLLHSMHVFFNWKILPWIFSVGFFLSNTKWSGRLLPPES